MMEINKIYNEDCLKTMGDMPNDFVDLTVTSPPYDNLRKYNGYSFDFESIAKGLFRVTKIGGLVVWIVGDATVKGSETGSSFRQVLFFKDCGFRIHDTMIWNKCGLSFPESNRYYPQFEYMFVLSKGKPKTFNAISDRKNESVGNVRVSNLERHVSGDKRPGRVTVAKEYGVRYNIWKQSGSNSNKLGHPASFPERLAGDHILSWSSENDLIYDPFMGSGTTAKMAIKNNRNWIGSEISKEYCDIIKERLLNEELKQEMEGRDG